jgi:PAS domain S-box-containing protein
MTRKGKTMTKKKPHLTTPALLGSTSTALRNWPITWLVPVVGLLITITATMYMKSSVERIAEQEFTLHCNEIKNNIINRLDDHARILLSGAALFNASETVTREEWRVFNKAQKVEKQLPGIQGIGFSLLIPPAELSRHIQKIRREGFPQYKLRPDGVREIYSSIIYLEPFSGRNLRAFGYDMFSEPVRRSAMERARDTDTAALSGKVVLVQETDKEVQAGTLMYVPVYRKGMPIQTIEQRRAAIYGWIYSPYRMNDLMRGIIGNHSMEKEKQLHLQVFDGAQPSIQSLLYDSQPMGDQKSSPDARFTRQIPVDFNGQRWTLRFTQTGGGFAALDYIRVWLTLVSGIIISLLLFSLIFALLNTRAKARITENLAAEQRETKEYLENLIDYANVPIVVWNPQFHIIRFNHAFESLTGRVSGDVLGNNLEMLFPPDLVDNSMEHIKRTPLGEHWESLEISIMHVNGSVRTVLWNSATIFAEDGTTPIATIVQGTDITDRKRAEKEIIEQRNLSRKYLQIAGVMMVVLNSAGEITLINRKGLDILEYQDEQELLGKNWFEVVLPKSSVAEVRLVFTQLMEENIKSLEFYENTVLTKNGEMRIIAFHNTLLRDKEGNPSGILSSGEDITAIKQSEENLQMHHTELTMQNEELRRAQDELEASRTRYFDLYDLAPVGYCTVSDTGFILEANLTAATLLGITRNNLIKQRLTSSILPEDQDIYYLLRKNILDTGQQQIGELRMIRKDEPFFWARIEATIAQNTDDKPVLRCAISDITVSKQSEEKIKLSLREKETLLKEIHHRVKNNLQIISSLLNLQTGYIGDEKMEGIFRECRDRITAMASVHALLYKSQNLAEIDFGEYVRETANQLFRSYKTGRMDISLVIQAENVLLPIDTAIPCGLIINELVTNALKHAFLQTGKGEIKIAMNRTAPGIELLFEDNGIGFPKTADFYQSETFGLKLVHLLVKQLDGSIEQVIDGGTRYTIMFKTATQQEA